MHVTKELAKTLRETGGASGPKTVLERVVFPNVPFEEKKPGGGGAGGAGGAGGVRRPAPASVGGGGGAGGGGGSGSAAKRPRTAENRALVMPAAGSALHYHPLPTIEQVGGVKVENEKLLGKLRRMITMKMGNARETVFPGAQPVSMTRENLHANVARDDYFVCEKSDGVRYLLYMLARQHYLIDRKFNFYSLNPPAPTREQPQKSYFPLRRTPHPDPDWAQAGTAEHHETLLDGELLIDIDPITQAQELVFCIFDAVLINGVSVMNCDLMERLRVVQNEVIMPRDQILRPELLVDPFAVRLKHMYHGGDTKFVLEKVLPTLHHGNDGLIFTPVDVPYKVGTCRELIKWKPPDQNSIDFMLREERRMGQRGHILELCSNGVTGFYGYIYVDEDQLRDIRLELGLPPDASIPNCVVECVQDPEWRVFRPPNSRTFANATQHSGVCPCPECYETGVWKYMRVRDDKSLPNDVGVVKKIQQSIRDGVVAQEVVDAIQGYA